MNVVTLMAGSNEAFEVAGARFPKNLVEVAGSSLVELVVKNYASLEAGVKHIFPVLGVELDTFYTGDVISLLVPGAIIVPVAASTAGAACTALLAIEYIDNDDELLICNGDMSIDVDLGAMVESFRSRRLDGGILVFEAVHPRWSYVRLGEDDLVVETAEKRPISTMATAGVYYFRRGSDFVRSAFSSIKKGADVGGAYYVCPVYNELILMQARIGVSEIARARYHALTEPRGIAEYEDFLRREDR